MVITIGPSPRNSLLIHSSLLIQSFAISLSIATEVEGFLWDFATIIKFRLTGFVLERSKGTHDSYLGEEFRISKEGNLSAVLLSAPFESFFLI
ncbi:hypothetical protein TNCT_626771 [Trichonephila clavata]|uniref:Uncharacterized protein n=1 Tax=Trichonephila clavata TaxID=2740835 RepID=A0A8X6LTK6_TRICU|nr:hypothetical protein TNCT_626771 [Trichonephila clavata]